MNQIRYNYREFGVGWVVNDILVHAVSGLVTPTLSLDAGTGDIYCFWTEIGTDHAYYKKYDGTSKKN